MSKELDYTGIVTNVEKRWEKGMKHHPKSEAFQEHIRALEKKDKCDYYIDFGGDGDIGETILYLLDSFFEAQEKKNPDE